MLCMEIYFLIRDQVVIFVCIFFSILGFFSHLIIWSTQNLFWCLWEGAISALFPQLANHLPNNTCFCHCFALMFLSNIKFSYILSSVLGLSLIFIDVIYFVFQFHSDQWFLRVRPFAGIKDCIFKKLTAGETKPMWRRMNRCPWGRERPPWWVVIGWDTAECIAHSRRA